MLFNSIDFLFFFPIVVGMFYVIPKRIRYIWLLITSYYFYMGWNPKYASLIALSTFITYISSLFIEKCNNNSKTVAKKFWLIGSLVSNLGILCLFKYANFFLDNISQFFAIIGFAPIEKRLDILLPVGISFYTFQALSYTIDVYRGTIKAERNVLKYALFVSFFPQLVAGPIERSGNLLTQIQNIEKIRVWNFERVKDGFLLMIWGLFQKLMIADRAAILVNNVINNFEKYGFVEISIAMVLFAFQIYCDFGGYTNIARGAAQIMGFELMNNFKQPYLATSIKEFWRRWHISLTSWFTDYLYIPLGGNRKGTVRKYVNILIVFGVSGLWHGASWNFIAWGLLHAVYQIIGDYKAKVLEKAGRDYNTWSFKVCKGIGTFVLVDFAWIFFVCSSMSHALEVIRQMFTVFKTVDILDMGLDGRNWALIIIALLILLIVDVLHERQISVLKLVNRQWFVVRWIIYVGLVWSVIMFGIYGIEYDTSTFIYFQF